MHRHRSSQAAYLRKRVEAAVDAHAHGGISTMGGGAAEVNVFSLVIFFEGAPISTPPPLLGGECWSCTSLLQTDGLLRDPESRGAARKEEKPEEEITHHARS